jgi:WD40 repeat protein
MKFKNQSRFILFFSSELYKNDPNKFMKNKDLLLQILNKSNEDLIEKTPNNIVLLLNTNLYPPEFYSKIYEDRNLDHSTIYLYQLGQFVTNDYEKQKDIPSNCIENKIKSGIALSVVDNQCKFNDKEEKVFNDSKSMKSQSKIIDQNLIKVLNGHTDWVQPIVELNNGFIASGGGDNSIRLWNPNENYSCVKSLIGHTSNVYSVIQLNNGLIASGGGDGSIRLWDPNKNFACVKTIVGHSYGVYSVIQLKNELIASGSHDNSIRLWDPDQNFTCIKTLTGHTSTVRSVTQLNNGLIASASLDKSIKIWDPYQNYACVKTLTGHTNYVYSVTQLNNGLLASGSHDYTIRIWSL